MRLFASCLLAVCLVHASVSELQETIISATGETQPADATSSLLAEKDGGSDQKNATAKDHGQAMIDWVRANGGFVHESLFIGPILAADDSDSKDEQHFYSNTPYSLFAREPIKAGETILIIPYELTIHTHADKKFDQCETARTLNREMKLGADSFYAPYVEYLRETQTKGQVPTLWSQGGQTLLQQMLRHETMDSDGDSLALPPYDVTTWEYLAHCRPKTADEEFALELLRYRSWDEVLIPVYDMMSHSNDPGTLNTASSKIMRNVEKEPIVVNTTLDVPAGGQFYCSYNVFTGSMDLASQYGTPGLLMDYGFVEQLPQRWFFDEYEYMYGEEEDDDEDGREDTDIMINFELSKSPDGEVTVVWLDEWMKDDDIEFARDAIQHLKDFDKEYLQRSKPETIPEQEWSTIREYNHAMTFALEAALSAHFYDPLKLGADDRNAINEETFSEDRHYTCDHIKSHSFVGHKTMEQVLSHYQRLEFDVHPRSRETCFWLDMYVQQCTSYRPHYHEVAIHYTARYLDKVERIAWIGGGDSMLLHDALKYPSLELALGLELDQKVTRYNYKYMGSQPHYDNDKVQWWYGDATKSLLMLPQEYFGSFDMIVIDLSDTAMQLSVTSDLSIFAALSLLLRPGGIMVKNEEYLEQFSRVFDYTIQAHFYDVPIVCSQSFILGSYGTDFLAMEPKDHKPSDLMFVDKRPDIQSKFGIWHDYRRNITRTNAHCRDDDDSERTAELAEQTTSPGILMVVEAESVTANLASTELVKDLLVKALEKDSDIHVIEAVVKGESGIIGIILDTGYVIARTFPKFKYCAFDIHFWSRFELQEGAKSALIAAIGGGEVAKSVSSYRIVAGGMFGVDTWKDDAKKQGPRKVQECERRPASSRGVFHDQAIVDQITEELLSSLIASDDNFIDVLLVCGTKSTDCKSSIALKKLKNINKVYEVRACENTDDYISMEACETEKFKAISSFAKSSQGFNGFHAMIIDPEAPKNILQIMLNLFKTWKIWESYAKKDGFLILANSMDTTQSFRRAFLDRFRRETTDPAYRAEVMFNSTDSSMETGLFLYGVPDAVDKVTNVIAKIEAATGLASEVRNIAGGMFRYQDKFNPALVYKHSDFDMRDALAQWDSQKPTGFQTIFQFVKLTPEEQLDVHDKILVLYPDDGQWYPGKVVWVHPADDTVDVRYDSGDIGKGVSTNLVRKVASDTASVKGAAGSDDSLSAERIRDALTSVLSETKFEGMDNAEIYHYAGPGEGSMTMAFWSGGNAVALWDGRSHIDLNLFTYSENVDVADTVQELVKKHIPLLKTALRDEQPRGYGRVVSYLRDVKAYDGHVPVWAKHLENKGASGDKQASYL